jgi:hypothetical protein
VREGSSGNGTGWVVGLVHWVGWMGGRCDGLCVVGIDTGRAVRGGSRHRTGRAGKPVTRNQQTSRRRWGSLQWVGGGMREGLSCRWCGVRARCGGGCASCSVSSVCSAVVAVSSRLGLNRPPWPAMLSRPLGQAISPAPGARPNPDQSSSSVKSFLMSTKRKSTRTPPTCICGI